VEKHFEDDIGVFVDEVERLWDWLGLWRRVKVCIRYGVAAFASFLALRSDGDAVKVTCYLFSGIVIDFGERVVAVIGFRCSWLVTHGILDPRRSSTQLSAIVEHAFDVIVLLRASVPSTLLFHRSPESVQVILCLPLSFHI
jgi:hypothetical protein